MRCEEIMTKNPVTLPIEATVLEAARLMAEKDVGFIPLVDKAGKAVGTVTDRDIVVRCIAKGIEPKAKLKDFGGNEVICCLAQDDIKKAEDLMKKHQIQRILVCDSDHKSGHKPVGVISLQDLAEAAGKHDVGETVKQVKQEGAPSVH